MLRAVAPHATEATTRRALRDLKKAERIISHRAGLKSYWEKV
jgi:hypothetical protein